MDKQWFNDEMNKLEVPIADLNCAIKNGITRAKQEKPLKGWKKQRRWKVVGIAAIVSIGILGSGFFSSYMNGVLAEIPIIGNMYATFHDSTGEKLSNRNLIKKLDEKVVSAGIEVTATSAYYDGGKIAITFEVDKSKLAKLHEDIQKFPFDFESMKDGKNWKLDASFNTEYTEDTGLMIIEFYPSEEQLPDNYTLPITLTDVGGTTSEWKFDIPVQQLAHTSVDLKEQTYKDKEGEYSVTFDRLVTGEETSFIDMTIRTKYEKDTLYINDFYTNDGKEVKMNGGNVIRKSNKVGDMYKIRVRKGLEKVPASTKDLHIYMNQQIREESVHFPLTTKLPFEFSSKRKEGKTIITDIKHKDGKLFVDYEYKMNEEARKEFIINHMNHPASPLGLYETAYLTGEKVYNPEKKGQVEPGTFLNWVEKTETRSLDKLQFQAVFNLEGQLDLADGTQMFPPIKKFNMNTYSLEVDLPSEIYREETQEFTLKLK
ncbi:DUF4179 domain-containing protein [Priestia taiwanensis]|uniref:DUF4179 domain-containing protein n=1 Tax=Priestia taiwanensis TaxID=1347902 RepID=A0A917AX32_9BACI|nr:DUF4179 domain-containing protein [Priestia taiwanensis]MBM7364493.1 hypothetical protein [Priestia taiwanensis]GGE81053.1 hypothetical protein GCM10007140_33260 [Priestia taiwanensis]